jgi:hypothetical protein
MFVDCKLLILKAEVLCAVRLDQIAHFSLENLLQGTLGEEGKPF